MGKIATKTFCNSLKSGAFSGTNLNQCPTKAQIVAAGLKVAGIYEDNQLVQETDISYEDTWIYTFEVSPITYNFPAEGGSFTPLLGSGFEITSYKQHYVNGEPEGEQIALGVNFGNVEGDGFNTDGYSVIASNNTTALVRTGQFNFIQNESNKTVTITLTQNAGVRTTGYARTFSPGKLTIMPYDTTLFVSCYTELQILWNGIVTDRQNVTTSVSNVVLDMTLARYLSASVYENDRIKVDVNSRPTAKVSGSMTVNYSDGISSYVIYFVDINV